MDLSPDTLRHVARLARLRLDDAELARLGADVAAILTHFEALGEGGAPEDARAPAPPRGDAAAPALADRENLLANVPRREADGRLKVVRPS